MNNLVKCIFFIFNVLIGTYSAFGQSQCLDDEEYYIYTSIEEALKNPEEVIALELFDKNLKEVPIEIEYFKNLKSLCLSNNEIQQLPEFILLLDSLQTFVMENNQLEYLPQNIDKMTSLSLLVLNFNKLKELPITFSKLPNLKVCYLGDNKLKKLPLDLKNSPKLNSIDVRGNKISQKRIKKIQKLNPNLNVWYDSYHWYSFLYLKNLKSTFNSK